MLGDRVQLSQVLQNLMSNALKFHREDEPLHVRVAAETARERDVASITVEDNGIGFEDEYAERIFGTFQRLHGRGEYEGTGIGLSIARKIAWRHDGDITATGVAGTRARRSRSRCQWRARRPPSRRGHAPDRTGTATTKGARHDARPHCTV